MPPPPGRERLDRFGNLMDAEPGEGAWTDGLVIEESHFDLAKQAGFDSVRIPIRFSAHAMSAPPYTIDPAFMERVDQVVRWGLAKGLRVVIDLHHYQEIQLDPDGHRERFFTLWKQIAQQFATYPGELYFELMNEPNTNLTAETWSAVLAECIRRIRQVDGYHTIVVDAAGWSSVAGLMQLVVPETETNAIVTFHYYNPNVFLVQGQGWAGGDYATMGIVWPGPPTTPVQVAPTVVTPWILDWLEAYNSATDADQIPGGPRDIREEIAAAAQWGTDNGRPLWMSEFCAQDGGDMESRARWTRFVREELEAHQIPWSFWTLLSHRAAPGSPVGSEQRSEPVVLPPAHPHLRTVGEHGDGVAVRGGADRAYGGEGPFRRPRRAISRAERPRSTWSRSTSAHAPSSRSSPRPRPPAPCGCSTSPSRVPPGVCPGSGSRRCLGVRTPEEHVTPSAAARRC